MCWYACVMYGCPNPWWLSQVSRLHGSGNLDAARLASMKAKKYTVWAFTSILIVGISLVVVILAGLVLLLCFAIDCNKTSCDWWWYQMKCTPPWKETLLYDSSHCVIGHLKTRIQLYHAIYDCLAIIGYELVFVTGEPRKVVIGFIPCCYVSLIDWFPIT